MSFRLFGRKQDEKTERELVAEEISGLLKKLEPKQLTSESLEELEHTLEHSCRLCDFVPIKLYDFGDDHQIMARVGKPARLDNVRVTDYTDFRALNMDVTSNFCLAASYWFDTEIAESYFSIIPISEQDLNSCVGLYFTANDGPINYDLLLLKIPYCKENFPAVYRQVERIEQSKELQRKILSQDLSVELPEPEEYDDGVGTVVFLGPIPLWVDGKGIRPLGMKDDF